MILYLRKSRREVDVVPHSDILVSLRGTYLMLNIIVSKIAVFPLVLSSKICH